MRVIDVINEVRRRVTHPAVAAVLENTSLYSLIVQKYISLLNREDWSFLREDKAFNVRPPYSTGTITVSNGSSTVTGTNTNWDSSIVGGYFKVPNNQPLRIISVNSPTSLTLESAWPSDSLTNSSYTIIFPEYSFGTQSTPVSIKRIVHLSNGRWRLVEVSDVFMRRIDPYFNRTGIPLVYALSPRTDSIILWPAPSMQMIHRIIYQKMPVEPTSPSDVLIWDEEPKLLVDAVLSDILMQAYQSTNNPHFATLAQAYDQKFAAEVDRARDRDSKRRYIPIDLRNIPTIDLWSTSGIPDVINGMVI